MQHNIVFKNENGKIYILAKEDLNYDGFIEALKNRLEKLYINENLLDTDVIIDIKNISLDARKILNIFDVLEQQENIYVSKIIYNENKSKNIILHEGTIRSGENKFFANNTLLIGNINKGAKVIVYGDLYVLGKVNGDVILKNKESKLMASYIESANVKICSIEKKIENNVENGIIKIDINTLQKENFINGGDILYGKSDCSYIW